MPEVTIAHEVAAATILVQASLLKPVLDLNLVRQLIDVIIVFPGRARLGVVVVIIIIVVGIVLGLALGALLGLGPLLALRLLLDVANGSGGLSPVVLRGEGEELMERVVGCKN